MGWNYEAIREHKAKDATRLADWPREKLIARIIDLEVALDPLVTTLGSLDDKLDWPRASMSVSSKLWPMTDEDGKSWLVFNKETSKSDPIEPPKPERLHEVEYYTQDGLSFDKNEGGKLHDDFEIIGVHQSALASYIFCGHITMKDVRHAAGVLRESH